jgi:hypothetical protein
MGRKKKKQYRPHLKTIARHSLQEVVLPSIQAAAYLDQKNPAAAIAERKF